MAVDSCSVLCVILGAFAYVLGEVLYLEGRAKRRQDLALKKAGSKARPLVEHASTLCRYRALRN